MRLDYLSSQVISRIWCNPSSYAPSSCRKNTYWPSWFHLGDVFYLGLSFWPAYDPFLPLPSMHSHSISFFNLPSSWTHMVRSSLIDHLSFMYLSYLFHNFVCMIYCLMIHAILSWIILVHWYWVLCTYCLWFHAIYISFSC